LWEAIVASVLIRMSSLPVIYRIFRERSTFGMSEEMLTLYRSFPNFNPGQFRKMMKCATINLAKTETVLIDQNVMPTHLFLTVTDGFMLQRDTLNAELGPGNFLGEISFLLGGPATATVTAKPGSSYVAWDLGKLHYMMEKSPTMSNAISVLLNRDVARKLAVSFPSPPPSMMPNNLT
jgi:CRP-like cAMP-binding protein